MRPPFAKGRDELPPVLSSRPYNRDPAAMIPAAAALSACPLEETRPRRVMDDLFLRLTPDWVIRSVEAGGFHPTGHCLALNCLENRVYDLKLEDESHVVVKF